MLKSFLQHSFRYITNPDYRSWQKFYNKVWEKNTYILENDLIRSIRSKQFDEFQIQREEGYKEMYETFHKKLKNQITFQP